MAHFVAFPFNVRRHIWRRNDLAAYIFEERSALIARFSLSGLGGVQTRQLTLEEDNQSFSHAYYSGLSEKHLLCSWHIGPFE